MIQYYAPDLETRLELPEEEARHCLKVLRTPVGSLIRVVDGIGGIYTCRTLSTDPRHAAVEIVEKRIEERQWPTVITVAVAPTKNSERIEWLVEKLTEVGVDRIIPVICCHSERRNVNVDRLNRVAVAAMKQSLKSVLPTIEEATPLSKMLAEDSSTQRFIGYCDDSLPRLVMATTYKPIAESATVLIGPEGDFSAEEVKQAMDCGFKAITLGPCRLRTETAALTGCQTIHILNQSVG